MFHKIAYFGGRQPNKIYKSVATYSDSTLMNIIHPPLYHLRSQALSEGGVSFSSVPGEGKKRNRTRKAGIA
jgi:hypothetical protein